MPRSLLSAQRAFPIALVVTLAIALLPAGALGWVRPFTEIARIVILPFADIGNGIANWIRPPQSSLEGVTLDVESLRHFQQQMYEYDRLYIAEQARADELERQLQQLQNAPPDMPKHPVKLVLSRIGSRAPLDAHGSVVLNRGNRDGVAVGTVAAHDHVHLIGWVSEASHLNCVLTPLSSETTQRFLCALLPKDRPGGKVSLAAAPRIELKGQGDGTFMAEPDNSVVINVGDEAVLVDEDWPAAAQGMKVGVVESVRPNDHKALRNTVIVRPKYQISEVRMVVLRIDDTGAAPTRSGAP